MVLIISLSRHRVVIFILGGYVCQGAVPSEAVLVLPSLGRISASSSMQEVRSAVAEDSGHTSHIQKTSISAHIIIHFLLQ
jgi:hypothetical protein